MHFKLGNSTIRVVLDTHHLNIISIILCFNIFPLFWAIYHNTIYAIIWIGIHRTLELLTRLMPFLDRLYLILAKITGLSLRICDHHTKCKWSTLKLLLLRFDWSHQYLYSLIIFYLCEISDSEQYMAIFGNSPAPVQKVSAICCKYYYFGWIHIT